MTFEVSRKSSGPDDPRIIAAATIQVVCSRHREEVLIEWCMNGVDGDEWVRNPRGYRTENVAPRGTADAVQDTPFAAPDAETDDDPHLRGRFRCPTPGCNYDAQIRTDRLWPAQTACLAWMVARGIPSLVITDVDLPELEAVEAWTHWFGPAAMGMSAPPVGRVIGSSPQGPV